MATYKTPGVYVEEISTLPASVAQVETAIPAFIGWTEKAEKGGKSLKNVPTRIKSLVEYKELFGGPASLDGIDVDNNNPDAITIDIDSKFYLFNSLKLFYANGGGPCYIVSVGSYSEAYQLSGFTKGGDYDDPNAEAGPMSGLKVLEKFDEPTLIVCPDTITLASGDYYDFYKKSMKQCEKLKDRFTVIDLIEGSDWSDSIDDFRNNIGVENLKYGAAYTPNVYANLDVSVRYRDLDFQVDIINQTNVQATKDLVTALTIAVDNVDLLADGDAGNGILGVSDLLSTADNLRDEWEILMADLTSKANTGNAAQQEASLKSALEFLYKMAELAHTWNDSTNGAGGSQLPGDIDNQITTVFNIAIQDLDEVVEGAKHATGMNYTTLTLTINADLDIATAATRAASAAPFTNHTPIVANTGIFTGATPGAKLLFSIGGLTDIFNDFYSGVNSLVNGAALYETTADANLYVGYPLYKRVVDLVTSQSVILPPSGAIVGQYATVDRTRGVWKAPANVSLTGVTALTYSIDNDDQDGLNVDVNAGKSINAIRAFTGKGILIWGARTLAGNDNEWRYVPVRRLYIMVEESIKKATEFVVFEPNDANTWVRVRGMISSYLTELWRQGALAGAKPSQAFFVNVGLGETMTPQDILEGRLIIEIGMAAVRPAEFIILKFSHKLQEA